MATASTILARIEQVNIQQLVENIFNENASIAEDLVREQLSQGLTGAGTYLPDYSKKSIRKGKPDGPIKLYDEGGFYKGIDYTVDYGIVYEKSTDSKSDMLEERYDSILGYKIFQLTTENKRIFAQRLLPLIVSELKLQILQT